MSIESKSAHHSAKSVSGVAHHSGKKPVAGDASAGGAGGGFSALMSLIADTVPTDAVNLTDALPAGVPQSPNKSDASAPTDQALIANGSEASISTVAVFSVPVVSVGSDNGDQLTGSLNKVVANKPSYATSTPVTSMNVGVLSDSKVDVDGTSALPVGGLPSSERLQTVHAEVQKNLIATPAVSATPTSFGERPNLPSGFQAGVLTAIPTGKEEKNFSEDSNAATSQTRPDPVLIKLADPMQANSRVHNSVPVALPLTAAQDAARMVSVMTDAQDLMRPQERSGGKSHTTQPGTGLEGAFGNALMDKLGISSTYEVAPTAAMVPDTQVAETVSYWVTHGVQSAELTLDGFGSDPVEVRISLDGDQAQIDFWSNQADVRQVLEGASAQLKEMLSSEGLQLTGMSVGTSGREREQGESFQPMRSTIRQAKLSSVEPLVATVTRAANRAVGQSLDLYV